MCDVMQLWCHQSTG